jgi:preprotein translocase subunit Sss1
MTNRCLPIVLKELMREVKKHHKDKRAYYLEILSLYTITRHPEVRRITKKCRQPVEDELEAIYDIHMTEATDHNNMLYIDLANLKGHYFIRESLD